MLQLARAATAGLLAAAIACGGRGQPAAERTPPPAAAPARYTPPSSRGGNTVMVVQIEGPLADIRQLTNVEGVRLQSGAHPREGNRHMVWATITRDEAVAEIEARGLTVRVTMSQADMEERSRIERESKKP